MSQHKLPLAVRQQHGLVGVPRRKGHPFTVGFLIKTDRRGQLVRTPVRVRLRRNG